MKVSFEKIEELSSQLVNFHSVKLGADPVSEFEKFDSREFDTGWHETERRVIYQTIRQIAFRGAKSYFFREEGPAWALPRRLNELASQNKLDFGLRLYVVLVNEFNVVLLNGGVKTKLNPRDCPNVQKDFSRAVKIALAVNKAINSGYISFFPEGFDFYEHFQINI